MLPLSAIQELHELEQWADTLWPVVPANLLAYEQWLADARVLVDGRSHDAARGIAAHPGRRDHEAKPAEIRTRALPQTQAQIAADRQANPLRATWESE